MKTYHITLKADGGPFVCITRAESIAQAKQTVCDAEKAPLSAVTSWRVIPTARQVRRTKNLLRTL